MQNNIFSKLFNRKGSKHIDAELGHSLERQGISNGSLYSGFKSNDYENAYPSVSKLSNAFMMIEPFTVDKDGKKVSSNILDRFYHPNVQMSAADWREALAVFTLVHSKTYIRVHHRTTRMTQETIIGFTILEGVYEYTVKGKPVYQLTNGEKLDDSTVMVLKGVNPYGLSLGFSPLDSARKWVNIDDYIAAYQSGFFANGAVPSGQFLITARTQNEFRDIVAGLKDKHRGADKNNNVVYTYNQFDPSTGKTDGGSIQWIPFNTSNKDLALKDIFDQANKKIDSAFGVPASIRGVNDQNSYASVRIDEVIFMKYVIDPLTTKIYSKITHELNRMTGGTGLAFDFDIVIPQVADEEKVRAESKAVDLNIITAGINAGYSLESIVTSFGLSSLYKDLKTSGVSKAEDDKLEVLTPEEMKDTPDQPSAPIGELVVSGGSKGTNPKGTKYTEASRVSDEKKIEAVAYNFMESQVNKAIKTTKAVGEATQAELDQFVTEMTIVMAGIYAAEGSLKYEEAKRILIASGITPPTGSYSVPKTALTRYAEYVTNVGESYGADTQKSIQEILVAGNAQGFTRAEVEANLKNILNSDAYRVKRLGVSEANRGLQMAGLESIESIQNETGVKLVKRWNTSSANPCPYCEALNGTQVGVTESFVPLGGIVTGTDGSILVNNFVSMDVTQAHPNCQCFLTYEVER